MDRGNTKQEILEASLELFSVQGFEATSISQITNAVGIRKASLYSHFENKQAILDALVQEVLEQYEEHSLCRCGAVLHGKSGDGNRRHPAGHRHGLRGRGHAGETVMENVQREPCLCKRVNCPRHGNCAACREHHHNSRRKKLTRCEKLQQKAVRNGIGSNR